MKIAIAAPPITPRQQPKQKINPITKSPRRETEETKKLSWVAFKLPPNLSYWLSKQQQMRSINQRDVKRWPNDDPHVTVRWGLHTKQASRVDKLFNGKPLQATVRFIGPEIFEHPEHDILVCRLESPQLLQLHRLLGTLPNTTTFPDYNPHVTVAYLHKGRGKLYQDHDFKIDPNWRFNLRDLMFHNDKRTVRLTGNTSK